MSITTYSELQTAAANWLARADLTSRIPEFIALAEAKFNRTLRVRPMEVRDPAFVINAEYVPTPAGFLETKRFTLNANPRTDLSYMVDESQATMYPSSNEAPKFFSVVGSEFRFAPVPSTSQTATLVYYKALTPLSLVSTNWLLTSHPDIYLYGTLLEAAPYLHGDERIVVWERALKECIGQLSWQDARSRTGNGMMVRVA